VRLAASLPRPPAELGRFTVQIGASQEKDDAVRLASRASGAGLRAYVAEARVPGKGLWYRVRVGAFPDRVSAERYRRDVERELKIAAAVMPSR
jgi:cell division septation protein DedD